MEAKTAEIDLYKARKAKDERGMTAESSWLCPLQIIKVSLLLAGLDWDKMSSRLKTQISMQVTDLGRGEWWRESTVFTAAVPHFLCLTTTLMTLFPYSNLSTPWQEAMLLYWFCKCVIQLTIGLSKNTDSLTRSPFNSMVSRGKKQNRNRTTASGIDSLSVVAVLLLTIVLPKHDKQPIKPSLGQSADAFILAPWKSFQEMKITRIYLQLCMAVKALCIIVSKDFHLSGEVLK